MIKFQKDELRLFWPFYLSDFLTNSFMIFMAYSIIYFKEFLSFTQVSLLFAIMLIAPLFFEVPTGIIADIFGRKLSTILSFFIDAITMTLLYFTTNFYYLILLFIIFGLAESLYSGAQNAWAVDSLIKEKKPHLKKIFFQKTMIIRNFATLISSVIGLIVVKNFSIEVIWLFSAFGCVLGGLVLFFKKENFDYEKRDIKELYKNFINTIKKGFTYTFNHKELFSLLGFMFLLYFIGDLSWVSWEPELQNIGLPIFLFGLTVFLKSIFGLLISSNYHRLIDKIGHKKSLMLGVFIISLLSILSFFIYNPYMFLIIFALHLSIWNSYFYPISLDYLHDFYVSKIRATLESITNMILMTATSISILIGGMLNDLIGPRSVILISGILILFSLITLRMIKNGK